MPSTPPNIPPTSPPTDTLREKIAVVIRHAQNDDLESLTQIYNHYVRNSIATFDTIPFAPEARRQWLTLHAEGSPHQLWVAEQRGALLGYASSSRFRPKPAYDSSVETSVYLHPDHLGKGLGLELYEHLFAALAPFALHRAYAGIAQPNPASVALHRAVGFELAGTFTEAGNKFGGFHDVQWFEKDLQQQIPPENARRSLSAVDE